MVCATGSGVPPGDRAGGNRRLRLRHRHTLRRGLHESLASCSGVHGSGVVRGQPARRSARLAQNGARPDVQMTACRSLISALAVATLALQVAAQTPATEGTAGRAAPSKALTDYEGVYEYQSGTKLVIVGAEPLLFAVLDDARYPLRPLGIDTFQNAGGETIPFRRSADGSVSGFVERGVFYARLSPAVDPEIAAAVRARPRPVGPDGRAVPYEYRMPADLGDGLAVGELSQAGLDRAVATRLVGRVVDGTYKDLHGILVYRAGRLVI